MTDRQGRLNYVSGGVEQVNQIPSVCRGVRSTSTTIQHNNNFDIIRS